MADKKEEEEKQTQSTEVQIVYVLVEVGKKPDGTPIMEYRQA